MSWRILGASVPGTSHQKNDIPCQDAHAYTRLPPHYLLLTLADGAGTAPYAAQGARLAADHALDTARARLNTGPPPTTEAEWAALLHAIFSDTRAALAAEAETRGEPLRAFATTLACLIASPEGVAAAQLGDGLVVGQNEAGDLHTLLAPQRGEYATDTNFLSHPNSPDHLSLYYQPDPLTALAAMTDGLTRLAVTLATAAPHPPFFDPLLAFAAGADDLTAAQHDLTAFLQSERVCARTDDDKTLLLAVWTAP